jgi:xanthine dehydrogenase YagR molybdenum-binding subunit
MADEITIRVPSGIVGAAPVGEIERKVSGDEAPTLPINEKLHVIGKPAKRLDGRLKVTGRAQYTSDVRLPGMLWASVIRSPHAHARLRSIDVAAAARYPGVRAVHVLEHLLGGAQLKDKSKEEASQWPVVRYVGQPIAAVAAVTPEAAEEAVRLVKMTWEVLPFVVDVDEARKPNAPLVFPAAAEAAGSAGGGGGAANVPQEGNVRGPARSATGDVEKGLKEAEAVIDMTFRTQVQTHSALETHGVVADWRDGQLTVWASTQGTHTVQDELAAVFGLKKSQVRVVTEFMGGGFGAKFGAGNHGVLATHLSKKAGAPVRLMLSRRDEHLSVGNRPNSVQRLRIGAKKDGTLTAIHLVAYGTGGTGTGAGAGGPAKNMYGCPNILTEESDVFTHAGPSAAFRAPGHPQGCFVLEQVIDALAEKLAMDPLALRDKIDQSAARREERRLASEIAGWPAARARRGSGPIQRGVGVAQGVWYRFASLDASCEVRIGRDGSVELFSAVQDIGTGIRTALAQVVAEELGLRPPDVSVRIGDTSFPVGVASGGSTTTGSITPAARNATFGAKKQLLAAAAPALGVSSGDLLSARDGKIFVTNEPMRTLSFRAACAKLHTEQVAARASRPPEYGGAERLQYGGVHVAFVALDVETGVVKVERIVAVHDCGRPLNPLAIESQINGGVLQGISYALYENRVLDKASGNMLNANLEQYKIVGAREVPEIVIRIIEEYRGRSSTDAGGIGEPATIPTAAAIANAIYHATGARVLELPMTPARVLAALAARKEGR